MRSASRLLFTAAGLFWMSVGTCGITSADNPPKADRELHVVGIYEGSTRTGDQIHGGRATVIVDRPTKRVSLLLVSYSSVTWDVQVKAGTQIEKIILGGYEPQQVKSAPAGAIVVKAFHEGGGSPNLPYIGYTVNAPRFRWLVENLRQWSDLQIASFFGTYRAQGPITVDRIQDDPRFLTSYPALTAENELPQLVFPAIHLTSTQHRHAAEASYGDFTLRGPIANSLKPLPHGVRRLTFDPRSNKYYGIAGHDAVEVDLAKNTITKMDVGFDVPRLSWPADVTFDSRRGRLLLVSSGGGGYLYAYDPKTTVWSVFAEKIGVGTLAYHRKHDCLYGIAVHHSEDGGKPALREFNSNGALLRETPLGEPIVPGSLSPGPGTSGTQLVAFDEYLIAIAAPFNIRSSEDIHSAKGYIYLIQPKTGKVQVTWKQPQ